MRILRCRSKGVPQPTEAADPPSKYPGLVPLAGAVERTADSQERRVASLDQRAGVLLGFAGILVGLILRDPSGLNWLSFVAAGVATAGALAAGFSILPRKFKTLDPRELLESWAALPADEASFKILSTMAENYEENEPGARKKARRVGLAGGLVVLSVVLIVIAQGTIG